MITKHMCKMYFLMCMAIVFLQLCPYIFAFYTFRPAEDEVLLQIPSLGIQCGRGPRTYCSIKFIAIRAINKLCSPVKKSSTQCILRSYFASHQL